MFDELRSTLFSFSTNFKSIFKSISLKQVNLSMYSFAIFNFIFSLLSLFMKKLKKKDFTVVELYPF